MQVESSLIGSRAVRIPLFGSTSFSPLVMISPLRACFKPGLIRHYFGG